MHFTESFEDFLDLDFYGKLEDITDWAVLSDYLEDNAQDNFIGKRRSCGS